MTRPKRKNSDGILGYKLAFQAAFSGLIWAIKTQPNFKIHLSLALLSLFLGWFLKISRFEFLLIVTFIFLGLMLEMLNTAIEKTNDAIDTSWREDIKIAKDVSAGAMLVFSIGAVVVASLIFLPKLYKLFF